MDTYPLFPIGIPVILMRDYFFTKETDLCETSHPKNILVFQLFNAFNRCEARADKLKQTDCCKLATYHMRRYEQ